MIVFRTDASLKAGFGRLIRSTYLASLLKSKSGILFCTDAGKDKIALRYLKEKNFSCCSFKELAGLEEQAVKSIVFDLKHFSEEDLRLLDRAKKNHRQSKIKTIQITGPGKNRQDVDIIIDASIEKSPYSGDKEVLEGPGFAVLHTRFRHFNKIKRKYRKKIKKVFVCLGGAVEYKGLRKVVDVLSRLRLEIKIAPGFYLKPSHLKTLRRIYPGIHFVGKIESLARPFFEADAALVTPGAAAYEAAAAGTPALYCYYGDQQKFSAESFEKQGAGLVISHIDDLSYADLVEKPGVLTLEKRIVMGNKGKQLVDGRGVYRVIDLFRREKII